MARGSRGHQVQQHAHRLRQVLRHHSEEQRDHTLRRGEGTAEQEVPAGSCQHPEKICQHQLRQRQTRGPQI